MRSSQLDGNDKGAPFNDFDMGLNATHLISDKPRSKGADLIKSIKLNPTEQQRVPLGSYREDDPPRGFSVEITPDPNPVGSVLTEVVSLGTSKRYRLVLHITNYSVGAVTAEVWRL